MAEDDIVLNNNGLFQSEDDVARLDDQIANVTGRAHDVQAGSDSSDAQGRRFTRGAYTESDFQAPSDPVSDYRGPTRMSEVTTDEEWKANLDWQEACARERFEDFNFVMAKFAEPELRRLMEEDPAGTREQLNKFLWRDDAAELAYRWGKELQKKSGYRAFTKEELEKMDPEEFAALVDDNRTGIYASKDDDDEESESFLTRREMKQMNELDVPSFARVLDALKSRGLL